MTQNTALAVLDEVATANSTDRAAVAVARLSRIRQISCPLGNHT
jgi:hypothetical protein